MRVDESTVILGPIDQVGWAKASATVTAARSERLRPRNGPPLAVSTRRATSPAEPLRRHWWMAQCSESTGRISAPGVRRTPATAGAPAISDSLLARASRFPAPRAARVTGSPANPTTPLTTTSACEPSDARASAPARSSIPGASLSFNDGARSSSASATTEGWNSAAWAASRSTERAAPSASMMNRSGSARTTSSVCVPIDPVDPINETVVGTPPCCHPLVTTMPQLGVRATAS